VVSRQQGPGSACPQLMHCGICSAHQGLHQKRLHWSVHLLAERMAHAGGLAADWLGAVDALWLQAAVLTAADSASRRAPIAEPQQRAHLQSLSPSRGLPRTGLTGVLAGIVSSTLAGVPSMLHVCCLSKTLTQLMFRPADWHGCHGLGSAWIPSGACRNRCLSPGT
jgi:hypothetical protein